MVTSPIWHLLVEFIWSLRIHFTFYNKMQCGWNWLCCWVNGFDEMQYTPPLRGLAGHYFLISPRSISPPAYGWQASGFHPRQQLTMPCRLKQDASHLLTI
jgi:hypothetical protein